MAEEIIKDAGYFVVIATHPKNPNHAQNARGRVQHLALSADQDTLTLCNMLVSFPCQRSYFENRRLCVVCQAKAKLKKAAQEKKEPIESEPQPYKYSFTINTDASYSHAHGSIAAYACWIRSSHYLIKDAGYLGEVPNSSVAELLAVEKALWLVDQLINDQEFLRSQRDTVGIRLYFNTDSLWTLDALKGTIKKSKNLKIAKEIQQLTNGYEIRTRHVQAHTRKDTKRHWVNDWCDKQAKAVLRQTIRKLGEAPSA